MILKKERDAMKTREELITPESDYFIYSPSRLAQEMFLYPMQCGHFTYQPGYSLTRESFDSFLLMYITAGELDLVSEDQAQHVAAGSFVLIDCYKKHSYSTKTGWECLWCHFDGITARAYYNNVVSHLNNVFSMPENCSALRKLRAMLQIFQEGAIVREPLMSKYLTDILTDFLLCAPSAENARNYAGIAEETISYISEHFQEDITVDHLAARAGLSQYHFIRTFKKETGFTPHEYLINTRIATARYLLKNSRLPVKEICFAAGFSSESVFCSAFKKHQGMTPVQYRGLD